MNRRTAFLVLILGYLTVFILGGLAIDYLLKIRPEFKLQLPIGMLGWFLWQDFRKRWNTARTHAEQKEP